MTDYKDIFAKNLQRQLFKKAKSQKDFATDCGFSTTIVSEWYNGRKLPRMDKVQQMADYFGCKVSDLILPPAETTQEKQGKIGLLIADCSDADLDKIIAMIEIIKGDGNV